MTPLLGAASAFGGGLVMLGFFVRIRKIGRHVLHGIGIGVVAVTLGAAPLFDRKRAITPPSTVAVPAPFPPLPPMPDLGDAPHPMEGPHTMNAATTIDEQVDGWRARQSAPMNPGDRS